MVSRKLKKALKSITIVYGSGEGFPLIGYVANYNRNTKWKRKAVAHITMERHRLYKSFSDDILKQYKELLSSKNRI